MNYMDNKKVRFSGADWFERSQNKDVIIGGVGTIGSWLSILLARIGFKLYIFDNDVIDETNMAGQLYKINQIGSTKVSAIRSLILDFTGNNNTQIVPQLFVKESMSCPIMISCFDNMSSRRIMFENWLENYKERDILINEDYIFIDGRMEAEVFQIYFVTPDKIEDYKKTLFDDKSIADLACSYKSTSHIGAMIASNMVTGLTNFISNRSTGIDMREVPFKVTYEAHLMNFNITINETIHS